MRFLFLQEYIHHVHNANPTDLTHASPYHQHKQWLWKEYAIMRWASLQTSASVSGFLRIIVMLTIQLMSLHPFFFSLFSAIRKSATLTSNLVDGLGKSLDIARGDPRHGDTAVLGRVDGVLRIRPLDLTIQSKGEN